MTKNIIPICRYCGNTFPRRPNESSDNYHNRHICDLEECRKAYRKDSGQRNKDYGQGKIKSKINPETRWPNVWKITKPFNK
jgi:hypothetical protein